MKIISYDRTLLTSLGRSGIHSGCCPVVARGPEPGSGRTLYRFMAGRQPVQDQAAHRLGRPRHRGRRHRTLLRREVRQHAIGGRLPRLRPADPDPNPRKLGRAQGFLDRAHPPMPARPAPLPRSRSRPSGRSRSSCTTTSPAAGSASRTSHAATAAPLRFMNVCGLSSRTGVPASPDQRRVRVASPGGESRRAVRRQPLHRGKTHVVPGAGIIGTGVSQPRHQPARRPHGRHLGAVTK